MTPDDTLEDILIKQLSAHDCEGIDPSDLYEEIAEHFTRAYPKFDGDAGGELFQGFKFTAADVPDSNHAMKCALMNMADAKKAYDTALKALAEVTLHLLKENGTIDRYMAWANTRRAVQRKKKKRRRCASDDSSEYNPASSSSSSSSDSSD